MNKRLGQIVLFLKEIEKLKLVERIPYLSDKKRRENDAEHTWHLAMMLLVLEKEFSIKFDTLKALKIILVHDLVEIDCGDCWVTTKEEKEAKHERELKAAKRIFSILPDELSKELFDLWLEYEEGKSNEAKVAKALDKVSYALQFSTSKKIEWPQPHSRKSAEDYAAPFIASEPFLLEMHDLLLNQLDTIDE